MSNPPGRSSAVPRPDLGHLRNKIGVLCHAVRAMSVAYLVWQLLDMMRFWMDGPRVEAVYRRTLKMSLPAISELQRIEAFAIQMFVWLLLLLTVVSIWKLLGGFLRGSIFTVGAARNLQGVGLFGAATVVAGVATLPIMALVVSSHVPSPVSLHAANFLEPQALLHLTFCLMIVALAHVFRTAAELAEDNEGFV